MRTLGIVVLVVVCFYVSLIRQTKGASQRRKSDSSGAYDCFMKQLCKCNAVSNYVDCWSKLHKKTQEWLVSRVNACEMTNILELRDFEDMVKNVCTFPEDEWNPCYDNVSKASNKYRQEICNNGDPEKLNECEAYDSAVNCLSPNIVKCSSFGGSC